MISNILLVCVAVVMAILMLTAIVFSATIQPAVQRIDCTWSEISPDFTTAMREACRKARSK